MIPNLLSDYVKTEFELSMNDIWTACPGVVTSLTTDFGDLRATVKPSINELYADGTTEEHLEILSVPVIMPGGQNSLISFPVNIGDTVLLVFVNRNMDNFKISNGQPTTPYDARKFQAEDAVAIPGLFPFAISPNRPAIRKFPHNPKQDVVICNNIASGTEVMLQFTQAGNIVINTTQDVTVNCKTGTMNATQSYTINTATLNVNATTTNWAGNIIHQGNYTQTGTSTFNGIPFATHKHTGVQTGTGTSAGPVA